MDRSEPNDQPAKKRQRLSDCVDGVTDGAEPMVLANGDAGSLHRREDDRVGPRKLIPRCRPRRAVMTSAGGLPSLQPRLFSRKRWSMLEQPLGCWSVPDALLTMPSGRHQLT